MPRQDEVVYCDGCGAEIVGAPVVRGGRRYCCQDCAEGLACDCALILDDERSEEPGLAGE
jgi:hypothetical protein